MAIGANIDPSTGLPMPESRGRPESTLGMYGSIMGENYGVENPLFYDLMDMIPAATTTTAWNMGRTRSTILNNRTAGNFGRNAGGLRQTFSPLRFGSFGDLSNIDPEFFGTKRPGRPFPGYRGGRPGYTPFNILSKGGNWLSRRKGVPEQYRMSGGTRAFAPGTFGTMSAMASINAGSYSTNRTAQVMGSINRFRVAGGVAANPFETSILSQIGASSRQSYMSSALGAARFSKVRYAGQAAGYFQEAQATRMGTQVASRLGMGPQSGYFGQGAAKAAQHLAAGGGKSMLARTVGSRGAALGLRAAGPVGAAMLAYDITHGLGKLAGRGLRLGVEGVRSAQGDLVKRGPMGMGYVDNSVAATSRQRGVMAISNSRLNMRSFLGQEAAYVHQNFG